MYFNMRLTPIIASSLLLAPAAAKMCMNMTVPVDISSQNGMFNLAVPQNNLDIPDLVLNITQQGRNFTDIVLEGYNTTSGVYNISTQFCMPSMSNGTKPVVQVLTHGIGFDKTYWDLPFNNYNYSYLDVATDKYKYCTLSFDRLGVGNSSHGEPLNEIQSFLEVEATAALTRMLRNGTFPGATNQTFAKVVHVGHSFGSAQTYSLVNKYPELSDGIILTGFSMNSSFVGLFAAGNNLQQANLNQPLRFSNITGSMAEMFINMYATNVFDYLAPVDLTTLPMPQNLPNGYMVPANAGANKYLFLKPMFYDPAILTLAEMTKQPVTVGELLTLGSVPMNNSFTGPVMVINGDSDLPYCGSNCTATGGVAPSFAAMVAMNFPMVGASNFTSYIQPNTGHGINLHYNATAAYDVMNMFLKGKGLMSS